MKGSMSPSPYTPSDLIPSSWRQEKNKYVTHVESIIVGKPGLEPNSKVTTGASHETKEDSGRRADVASARCDSDETCYRARAETNDGPFFLDAPKPEHPGETTD